MDDRLVYERVCGAETAEAEIEHLAVEEVLNRKMLAIPPGSEGLILQPYWGPGLRRPEARGAIIGFSDVHTRVHMYRAIVEGIAFALRDGLEGIENGNIIRLKKFAFPAAAHKAMPYVKLPQIFSAFQSQESKLMKRHHWEQLWRLLLRTVISIVMRKQ